MRARWSFLWCLNMIVIADSVHERAYWIVALGACGILHIGVTAICEAIREARR